MKKILWINITIVLTGSVLRAQTIDSSAAPKAASQQSNWTDRKTVAVILSTLIPGSGQTYLGHTEKGAAFTLTALGSLLMTITSENDIVGRNERLDELKSAYAIATSFIDADGIWKQMVETKDLLDSDVRRRNLFKAIVATIWVANLVDILFFSDDLGEKTFGSRELPSTRFALVPNSRNGVNAVISIHF